MKYFSLLLIILVSCGTSSILHNNRKCKDFEDAVRDYWVVDAKNFVNYSSRSFLDSIQNNYADCILNKDTSYMFKVLGRTYITGGPLFSLDKVKEYNLKMMYQFHVSTKKGSESNVDLCYGADSLNILRCVMVLGTGHIRN